MIDTFTDLRASVDDNESVDGIPHPADKRYFRQLSVDPLDSSRIYVGAV
jgi:hypothetical protein